ncbi:MAG: DUF4194 domain-containing protein [Acidimicrobiia bacterium]|nr:DUF4194 domain-containing protein [Acidimicrobiia bacterium]
MITVPLDHNHRSSIFDEITAGPRPTGGGPPAPQPSPEALPPPPEAAATADVGAVPDAGVTPLRVKQAVQELLRLGVLYAEAKPNLYQSLLSERDRVAAILEPLDLTMRVDEVRAMAILMVAPAVLGDDAAGAESPAAVDEWQHPLVRRQRLTLAQSLLLAILRRRYVEYEKTAGGAGAPPQVPVEELVPELQTYLGDGGSDSSNESRLRRLLEQLREHGIVSAVDDDDQVTIRPLICHVADPTSLQLLSHHYARLASAETVPSGSRV